MELALGILGTVLAIVALAGEWIKRPSLEVEPHRWDRRGDPPWDFLVVRIHNRPASRWIGWLFTRRSAEGCRVSLTYQHALADEPSIDQIPGRWSAAPEPISWGEGGPRPDPGALPNTYRHNVDTTSPGEEVAIARSLEGRAFAFSSESYLHPLWERPGWDLLPGRWHLTVRVASSDVTTSRALEFDVARDGSLSWVPPLG